MSRPRTIAGLVSKIISADSRYRLISIVRGGGSARVTAHLRSSIGRSELIEDIELPVMIDERSSLDDQDIFCIVWDASEVGKKSGCVTPFGFDGRDDAKRLRRSVSKQEQSAAEMIGGKAHAGSGAIQGLKSDASSLGWQLEAKQTAAKSVSVKLEWLDKISSEAKQQDKRPVMHIKFSNIPDDMLVEDEWVIMPRSAFEAGRW